MRATSVNNVKSATSGIPSSLADLPPEVQMQCLIEELTRLERSLDGSSKPRCSNEHLLGTPIDRLTNIRVRQLNRLPDSELLDLLCRCHASIVTTLVTGTGDEITTGLPYLERRRAVLIRVLYQRHKATVLDNYPYDKDKVKAQTDIATVIGAYTELKPGGHNRLKGLCPLHADTDPSLTVYRDSDSWWCYSCAIGGDVFTFLQEVEGVGFYDAVKMAANMFG